MKKIKKVITFIIDALCIVIIGAAVFALLTVVFSRSGGQTGFFGYHAFRVLSGSMEPDIPVDSLVIVREVDPSEIAVNDVITFYSRDPELNGSANTHRVTGIKEDNGRFTFTTKGDSNLMDDKYAVMESDLIGKVIVVSALAGKAVRLVSNPLVFAAVVIIPLLILMFFNAKDIVVTARRTAKLELAEALEAKAEALDPELVGKIRRAQERERIRERSGQTADEEAIVARARTLRTRSRRSEARRAGIERVRKKAVKRSSRARAISRVRSEREAYARRRAYLTSAASAPAFQAAAKPSQRLNTPGSYQRLNKNKAVNAARASAKSSYTRPSAGRPAGRRR